MKRRRDRPLRDEEVALWALVARSITPLPGRRRPTPPPAAEAAAETAAPSPRPANVAAPAKASLPSIAPLERRIRIALKRGMQQIEAVLDLHGMRQDEAHEALQRFLWRAQRDGAKLVLIVTGKGAAPAEGGFEERGVLRRVVPHWLRRADLRTFIVGFEEAGPRHGGSGALYVRLRRGAERFSE